MGKLAASILAADLADLAGQVKLVQEHADLIHIDIMDAHFVPPLTIGPVVVASLRPVTDRILHGHLMVEAPESLFDELAEAGLDIVSFHHEAVRDPSLVIAKARGAGLRVGVTPLAGDAVTVLLWSTQLPARDLAAEPLAVDLDLRGLAAGRYELRAELLDRGQRLREQSEAEQRMNFSDRMHLGRAITLDRMIDRPHAGGQQQRQRRVRCRRSIEHRHPRHEQAVTKRLFGVRVAHTGSRRELRGRQRGRHRDHAQRRRTAVDRR